MKNPFEVKEQTQEVKGTIKTKLYTFLGFPYRIKVDWIKFEAVEAPAENLEKTPATATQD